MNHRRCCVSVGLATLLPMTAGTAQADGQMNLTQGITDLSHQVDDLHRVMFAFCVVIGVGVCVAMLYSIVMHRKSRGVTASQFHKSTWVEIAWTVIPFLVLAAVAIPAARMLSDIADNDAPDVVSCQDEVGCPKDRGGHLPDDTELPEAAPASRAVGPGDPPPASREPTSN